jgi:O-antigen/teichoic acid export membrane protein
MYSLFRRTLILTFSRLANQALVLLSPMLLVRILSVSEFGAYREFMLYAALAGSMVLLGIPHSLAYFLPRYPNLERVWVTQASLFILATSSIAIVLIFVIGDVIRANSSFDFVTALQLYIFFVINLDFVENYWLGKKRTDYVLFYSSGRLIARISVVITVAWLARDAQSVVVGLIFVEGARSLLVLLYGFTRNWFTTELSRASLVNQMSYFIPLGAGGLIEVLNTRIGMLFVSMTISAEVLAFYAIGAFATQIVNIMRGAIADVIFPEIVELRESNPKDALPLWRRATIWYCILLFPVAVLFAYYADAVVVVLFTEEYAPAIPVFAVFAFALYFHCFDFHLPLRVQNANRYFMAGSGLALLLNLALLYPMYQLKGLIGPAVAYIVSRVIYTAYLGYKVARIYGIQARELAHWAQVGKVLAASLACAPILIVGKLALDNLLVRGIVFGSVYIVAYILFLRLLGLAEVRVILEKLHIARRPT